jgi:hypothetical protein
MGSIWEEYGTKSNMMEKANNNIADIFISSLWNITHEKWTMKNKYLSEKSRGGKLLKLLNIGLEM